MAKVTFQVLEGVDKGRVFRELATPVTIGREEGNLLRLNDERVSRFHAKVQQDNGDIILTDLESTNGTRVNGSTIQIRRLRPGDRIGIGRSTLLFGSQEEIAQRMALCSAPTKQGSGKATQSGSMTDLNSGFNMTPEFVQEHGLDVDPEEEVTVSDDGGVFIGQAALPPLPQKLSPAQAARLAEILDFLHRGITSATEAIIANDDGTEVKLSFSDWQRILAVQMLLARYLRAVAEPESMGGGTSTSE
jgi:pSer/pThr/pTyr-binding forkhead associated (FHA) protein